jgi:hypothetical protein
LQLLLALATRTQSHHGQVVILSNRENPRRILLRIRGGITAQLRTLGPRQFAAYQAMLERVRSEHRWRTRSKVRQVWPRRKDHKPPKPPLLRTMEEDFKMKIAKGLQSQTN